jgi:hypothetical protein
LPVERALELAPSNVDIAMLAGRMEVARGRLDEAVVAPAARRRSLDARALQPRFALADELQRAGTPAADAGSRRALRRAGGAGLDESRRCCSNAARLAAKMSDRSRLDDSVSRIAAQSAGWPDIAQEQLTALARGGGVPRVSGRRPGPPRLLRNVLARVTAFSESLAAVRTPAELIAAPLDRLRRARARDAHAPAAGRHRALGSRAKCSPGATPLGLCLTWTCPAERDVALSRGRRRRAASRRRDADVARRRRWRKPIVVALDWNHDFRYDLARAGAPGGASAAPGPRTARLPTPTPAAAGAAPRR